MGGLSRVVTVAVLGVASRAGADDARITAARAAYDLGQDEQALAILEPVIANPTDNHDRAVALRLAACADVVIGKRDDAIERFIQSFALEPEAILEPGLASSPDNRGVFEVARGRWNEELVLEKDRHAAELARLRLEVRAPSDARGGRPLAIGIDVDDPGKLVSRVELGYRRRGQNEFTVLTKRLTAPRLEFAIPPQITESPRPFVLEYHVTLRHRLGFDLRPPGEVEPPRTIQIAAGHVPRWYETWWFRGSVAVAVVGLGIAGYVAYEAHDVGPQNVVIK